MPPQRLPNNGQQLGVVPIVGQGGAQREPTKTETLRQRFAHLEQVNAERASAVRVLREWMDRDPEEAERVLNAFFVVAMG